MRIHSFLALLLCSSMAFAQGFKVKGIKLSKSDDLAAIAPRTDQQGRTCGLVKVTSKINDLVFPEAVGKVTKSLDEYWVYLPDGATSMTVARPHYLPTTVQLAEFGTPSVMGKSTYVMELKENDLELEKYGVTLYVKPASAQVRIDGVALKHESSGEYQLLLARGDHQCDFTAYGCRAAQRMVTTGKGVQRVELELESILASVNVFSQTEGAEILINDEVKGTGRWEGQLLPGQYVVAHRQKGYLPAQQTITLGEKEAKNLNLGQLEHVKGTLRVTTQPEGCLLWVDGEGNGQSPRDITGVLYGRHTLAAEVEAYGLKRKKEMMVKVEEEGIQEISMDVASDEELNLHREALESFRHAYALDVKGETANGYLPQMAARAAYDSIMDMMERLDSSFFVHREFFPEYETDALVSPQPCIGDRMFLYYTYVDLTEDEPLKLKGNVRYTYTKQPDKALRVAQKMGKELTRHEMAFLAICYYRNGNYEQAINWFRQWAEKGEAAGETEDYYAGRCYFCLGDAYKQLGQATEAKEWLGRALLILEKTEKNAARLKKFRQTAKET